MAKFIDLAKNSINKLENEVYKCNYYVPMSIVVTTKFLEDSFNEPEISHEEYENHKKRIDDLATKFSQNCICLKKDRIGERRKNRDINIVSKYIKELIQIRLYILSRLIQ